MQKQHRIFQFDWENSYLFIKDQQPYQALQNAVIAYAKQELPVLCQSLAKNSAELCRVCNPAS